MIEEINNKYKIPYKYRSAKQIEVYVTYNAYDMIINDQHTNVFKPTKIIQDSFYKGRTWHLFSGAKMENDTIYVYMWSKDDQTTRHPSILKLIEVNEYGKVKYHTYD